MGALRAAVAADPRAVYVPFGESLRGTSGEPFDASYIGFASTISQMYAHTGYRWSPLGPSFDALAARSGRSVVHDKIHLTERSAAKLLDLFATVLGPSADGA